MLLSTLRPYLLLGAILLALVAAVVKRAPRRLVLYLAVELATTGVLEAVAKKYGWRSPYYTLAYGISRPMELLAALYLSSVKISAGLVVVSATWCVYSAMDTTNYISLLTGAMFLLAGLSLGFQVPFMDEGKSIYGTLTAMWCFLALYGYGFAMGWRLLPWQRLNEYWPALICVAGFSVVAIRLLASAKASPTPARICR
jgi:hypothetical protein